MQICIGDLVLRHVGSDRKYSLGIVTGIELTHHGTRYIIDWDTPFPSEINGPFNEYIASNFRWNYLAYRQEQNI